MGRSPFQKRRFIDLATHPLGGIQKGHMGEIEFTGRTGEPVTDVLTLEQIYALHEQRGNYDECDRIVSALASLSPDADEHMGLSVVTKLRKPIRKGFQPPRRKRGLRGMTSRAKRSVRSKAKIMEMLYGRGRLAFLTATLPPLPGDERLKVCQNWPYLVRRFREEICRELERHGLHSEFLQVSEIQMKRYWKTGHVYPHIHALFCNKPEDSHQWILTPKKVDEVWSRLLENILRREVDCSAACEIDRVKKGVGKEMAKYLSKGGGDIAAIVKAGKQAFLPQSFTSSSRNLTRMVEAQTKVEQGMPVDLIFDNRRMLEKIGVLKCRDVMVMLESRNGSPVKEVCIGVVGYFRCENWQELLCETKEQLIQTAWRIAASHRNSVPIDRHQVTA
jgi:hypothetical protein